MLPSAALPGAFGLDETHIAALVSWRVMITFLPRARELRPSPPNSIERAFFKLSLRIGLVENKDIKLLRLQAELRLPQKTVCSCSDGQMWQKRRLIGRATTKKQ